MKISIVQHDIPVITELRPLHFGVSRAVHHLKPSDISWCVSDPGWILATVGSLLEPWTAGSTIFIHLLTQFNTKVVVEVRSPSSQDSKPAEEIPHSRTTLRHP